MNSAFEGPSNGPSKAFLVVFAVEGPDDGPSTAPLWRRFVDQEGIITADRETAEVFRDKYVDGHPVLLEGWDQLQCVEYGFNGYLRSVQLPLHPPLNTGRRAGRV